MLNYSSELKKLYEGSGSRLAYDGRNTSILKRTRKQKDIIDAQDEILRWR